MNRRSFLFGSAAAVLVLPTVAHLISPPSAKTFTLSWYQKLPGEKEWTRQFRTIGEGAAADLTSFDRCLETWEEVIGSNVPPLWPQLEEAVLPSAYAELAA